MNTIITSILGGEKFQQNKEKYLNSIYTLLSSKENFILFVDETTKDFFEESPTLKIYNYDFLKDFPYNDLVESLRYHPNFIDSAPWVKSSSQCIFSSHNPIIMSKPYMVEKSIQENPFNSEKFVWYDGGLLKNRDYFEMGNLKFKNEELTFLFDLFNKEDMYFMSTTYPKNSPEIHGFKKEGIIKILGDTPNYVCRGGNFGGGKDPLLKFIKEYDELLKKTLKMGYMGTEETIFTLLAFQNPQLYKNYIFSSYNDIYQSIYNKTILK